MKHKIAKKVLSATLAVTMLFGSGMAANTSLTKADLFKVSASATEYSDNQFRYDVTDGKVTIKEYLGTATTVTIPAEIGGKPVVAIGNNAFRDCTTLKTITILESVTYIGEKAFADCKNLSTLTFAKDSELGEIGEFAFSGTNIKEVTIPKKVHTLNGGAFGTTTLQKVTFEDGSELANMKTAFNGCAGLQTINLEKTQITSIDTNAFYGCTLLDNVTIPNGVTEIGYNAFRDCTTLKTITIPKSVTYIGEKAFADCKNLSTLTFVKDSDLGEIGEFAFEGTNIKEVTIPKKVHTLNGGTFGTTTLQKVTFEDGSELANMKTAFNGCTGLRTINLEKTQITSIDTNAFYRCTLLDNVTIPNGVTEIGHNAFRDCTTLKTITIPKSVTYIGEKAFADCKNLSTLTFAKDSDLGEIGEFAFEGTNIKEVTIPKSVITINNGTFGTTTLQKVTFEDGSELANMNTAFSGCTGLRTINLEKTQITSIDTNAFYRCTQLNNVTIPNGVTEIGHNAFRDCTTLKTITIPKSVTYIGERAFDGCGKQGDKNEYKINTVNYTGSQAEWKELKNSSGSNNDPLWNATKINYNVDPTQTPDPTPDPTPSLWSRIVAFFQMVWNFILNLFK